MISPELPKSGAADEAEPDFIQLCAMLPEGVSWGDELTADIVLEIVRAARAPKGQT
jgi:hypothetical protein